MKREVLAILSEAGGSCHSGFRRDDGVSNSCRSLKKKLFGAENTEITENELCEKKIPQTGWNNLNNKGLFQYPFFKFLRVLCGEICFQSLAEGQLPIADCYFIIGILTPIFFAV
jgi:hypothetical protein